jgi:hypothetical protein
MANLQVIEAQYFSFFSSQTFPRRARMGKYETQKELRLELQALTTNSNLHF